MYQISMPFHDPEAMTKFQDAMDALHDEQVKYIEQEANRLGVSVGCAECVVYLRSRSRWTQAAEDSLILMDKSGESMPNMNEYP